jgi:hypothetical protein
LNPNITNCDLKYPDAIIASKRLRESIDQPDALEGLREIVGTLLGSEEVALFKVDTKTGFLPLVWSFGIDTEKYEALDACSESVIAKVVQGALHIESDARSAPFNVLVPIRLQDQTVAILAILKLLPQKTGFAAPDLEVLQVLFQEAGPALFGRNAASCVLKKSSDL